MPIVDPTQTSPVPQVPATGGVVATQPKYKGVTVDTEYVSSSALMTHIEGSSWTVNYYSQVLGADSALAGQNVNRNTIYQQYKLIQGLELKVTSPLTSVQDQETKAFSIVGTANLYPCIIPNEGDMFLADIGDGREGIFRITLSERKAIFKDTSHTIEYILIDYSTPERIGDLNMKVIDTLVFVRDFLKHGQNPLLQVEDVKIINELQGYYGELIARYFKSFLSNEYKTLIIPGQEIPIYDHFLVKTVMSIFTTYDCPEIQNVRILNIDDDDIMKSTTIWDMLKAKDRKMHKFCIRQAGLVSTKDFIRDPMMEGIYHTGVKYVVYPLDPMLSVDYGMKHKEKAIAIQTLIDTPSQVTNLNDLLGGNGLSGLTLNEVQPINKVLIDDYYIFSQAFYDREPTGLSMLEVCTNEYLDDKAPNMANLLTLCSTAHAWNRLENFYYIPILLILIKASIHSL